MKNIKSFFGVIKRTLSEYSNFGGDTRNICDPESRALIIAATTNVRSHLTEFPTYCNIFARHAFRENLKKNQKNPKSDKTFNFGFQRLKTEWRKKSNCFQNVSNSALIMCNHETLLQHI